VATSRVEPDRIFPVVGQRDRRTLEFVQSFPVPRDTIADYTLDAYLYFPRSFGIMKTSFSADAFYRNARVFLRIATPQITLRDLCDLEHPHSPAAVLRRQLEHLLGSEPPSSSSLVALAQMYGAELSDAIRREAREVLDLLKRKKRRRTSELAHAVEQYCEDATLAFSALRRVRSKARAFQAVADSSLARSLAFAEEYAAAVYDEALARIGTAVDEHPRLRDGTGTALRTRLVVARAAETINERRLASGFAVPWGKSPEYFSYRIGLLKKELQRALYIDTRAAGSDPVVKNSAAAVAAALAATWAAVAQIPIVTGQAGGWSWRTLIFIGAAVAAYVLKDRIKDWTKSRLTKRWLRWDFDQRIRGDALANVGLGAIVGRAREQTSWVGESSIPAPVHRLRRTRRTVKGTTPELEEVLHWRRRISFEPEADSVPEGFALQETFRLSMVELLGRLDDPKDSIDFYDRESGRFSSKILPRVYHLNVILVSTENITGMRRATRYRVVVNRKGIKRIDHVADLEGLQAA
jgi:hypothetical protein